MTKEVGLFLPLPERLASQYPPEGRAGEDDSPVHVTLVYIGSVDDARIDELHRVLELELKVIPPLRLNLMPPRAFINEHGQTILHSPVGGPLLWQVNTHLTAKLNRLGFSVQGYDKFRPHVTIEYVDKGKPARFDKLRPVGSWVADSVGFWVDNYRRSIPLLTMETEQSK